MSGPQFKSVHGAPTITATQALRLEPNIPYNNCTLRGVVVSVCPLRPREYCKGNVFSASIIDNATQSEITVYFYNDWAVACSFLAPQSELSVKNFCVANNPNVVPGVLSGPRYGQALDKSKKDSNVVIVVFDESVVSIVSACDFTDKQTRVVHADDDDTCVTKDCMELTLSMPNLDQPQCRVVSRHKRNFNPTTNRFTVGVIKSEPPSK